MTIHLIKKYCSLHQQTVPSSWVSEDRLLLGAESGKVQLYEVGDLKHEYEVSVMRKQTSKQGSRVNSRASSWLGSRPASQQQTEMYV